MAGSGNWDEGLHPRANDGKFGAGSGAATAPKPKGATKQAKAKADVSAAKAGLAGAKTKTAAAKAKVAEARQKAKATAAKIVAAAKARAAGIVGKVKSKADAIKASGKKQTPKQKASLAKAKATAKSKAAAIVAKAKERAKAVVATKTGQKPKAGATTSTAKPAPVKPTKPVGGERSLASHETVSVIEHAATGKVSDMHQALNRQIESLGLKPTAGKEAKRGQVKIVADHEVMSGALGYRNWDGEIVMPSTAASMMKEFAASLGNRSIKEVVGGSLDRLVKKQQAARNAMKAQTDSQDPAESKALYEKSKSAFAEAQRAQAEDHRIIKGVEAMTTMVHESLHGYSPIGSKSYQGVGAQIEEITTESAARHIMAQHYGADLDPHDKGSYSSQINAATMAISELTGRSPEIAYDHLREISMNFKRRPGGSVKSPDGALDAFSADVGKAIGKPVASVRAALTKHLASAPL